MTFAPHSAVTGKVADSGFSGYEDRSILSHGDARRHGAVQAAAATAGDRLRFTIDGGVENVLPIRT